MITKIEVQIFEESETVLIRVPNPRQRILVVDDDADIRRMNTEVLICSGYHVDAAGDGDEAWNALQRHKYDLVVTDNDMPKVTGIELIEKLQAAQMALPVIMATGAVPGGAMKRRDLLQPEMTLLKPYHFEELLAAVKKVLRTASDSLGETAPPPNWEA
jgi:two-component system alkaline phosphatase synthesis response regulator PhoP